LASLTWRMRRRVSGDVASVRPPSLERFVRHHVPTRLKQRLKHDQHQILTATHTELSFAHLAHHFYDPALDGLPPSVSHT